MPTSDKRFARFAGSGEARSEICQQEDEGAQKALLHFTQLGSTDAFSLLEIKLETGRSHQIRLQASHRGHPIIGDSLYGSELAFGPECSDPRQQWIALHARELELKPSMGSPSSKFAVEPGFHWDESREQLIA